MTSPTSKQPAPATPLPWKCDHRGGYVVPTVATEGGIQVASLFACNQLPSDGKPMPDDARYNARYVVIACNAYPELVEALHKCLAYIVAPEAFDREQLVELVRAALARASGGTP